MKQLTYYRKIVYSLVQLPCYGFFSFFINTSVIPNIFFFFFKGCGPHRDLPSSPTRRSSDLARTAAVRRGVAGRGQVSAGPVVPGVDGTGGGDRRVDAPRHRGEHSHDGPWSALRLARPIPPDRKSTRLNSSHLVISYAAFCLK